jgi:hypothetical protein
MHSSIAQKTSVFLMLTFLGMTASSVGAQTFRSTTQPTSEQAASPAFLVSGVTRSSTAASQSQGGGSRHEGIGIGAEIGPIFSSFDEASTDFKNNSGLEGGIFFGGNRPGTVGVMGKVLYAKKGFKNSTGQLDIDLHYLEVPVLLRVNAGSSSLNGVLVYGLVGPVFDVLLKGSIAGENVKDNYQSLDVGLQFGAGVEITRFVVEGVYTKGLKNVLNPDTVTTITDLKTHSFAVLFGLRFN